MLHANALMVGNQFRSEQNGYGTQYKCFIQNPKICATPAELQGIGPIVIHQLAREGAEWHQFLEHPSRWDCSQCREILRYYHLSYYIQHAR